MRKLIRVFGYSCRFGTLPVISNATSVYETNFQVSVPSSSASSLDMWDACRSVLLLTTFFKLQ